MEQSRRSGAQATARPAEEIGKFAHQQTSQAAPPRKRAPKRALVVEANTSSLQLCRHILEHAGFDIETADSGIAALSSARERHPDLIVMDFQLPDVPGREFITWVRSIPALHITPIIILGGAVGEAPDMARIGPNALLQKPLSELAIDRAIREATKST